MKIVSLRKTLGRRGKTRASDTEMEVSVVDWSTCSAVEKHPHKFSGAWLFRGTRVPVSALFANIEGGATVEEFIEWFPGVSRAQVNCVLEHAQKRLAEQDGA